MESDKTRDEPPELVPFICGTILREARRAHTSTIVGEQVQVQVGTGIGYPSTDPLDLCTSLKLQLSFCLLVHTTRVSLCPAKTCTHFAYGASLGYLYKLLPYQDIDFFDSNLGTVA